MLSGGLDSSILAYEIKKLGLDLRAFTIVNEKQNDDYINAKRLANELKIPLNEIDCNFRKVDIFYLIDKILKHLNQPFSNPTPIYIDKITNEAAKLDYRVLLTGDGADEIFFGYPRHKAILHYHYLRKIPLSNFLMKQLDILNIFEYFINNTPYKYRLRIFIESFSLNFSEAYNNWVSIANCDKYINNFIDEKFGKPESPINSKNFHFKTLDQKLIFAQNHDLNHFLPNNILMGGDRSSMANSVELRFPFLDIEIIKLRNLIDTNKHLNLYSGKNLLKYAY